MAPVTEFQFPDSLAFLATVSWSVTGAIVARQRGFDFTGVFTLALISTTGGGLIRDGVFLQRTPVMLTDIQYIIIPFCVMVVISLFGGYWERLRWWDRIVNVIDAVGTPAYALIGFQLSLIAGIPPVGAMLVGMINGVAGGVIRDLLVGDIPQMFRPGQLYAGALIIGLLVYWGLLITSRVSSDSAAWVSIALVALIRWLVIRYNWQTFAVSEWQIEPALQALPKAFSGGGVQAGQEEKPTPEGKAE
ncbi:MAG TPA: TRIC cation channel family protein [Caldilineaceae bacterium]|nr:TRIC cation channel family protein [Caldilineaceae bacterium]